MEIEIVHEQHETDGEFLIENADGENAGSLFYTLFGTGRIIIQHTEVSRELQGTGASAKLIDVVADFARSSNKKIVLVCPFAKGYMNKKKEKYGDVLVG
tara:strand:+ start:111 stop:407 length:297 start_codon:yes stop_codon:yes gene_type:complete